MLVTRLDFIRLVIVFVSSIVCNSGKAQAQHCFNNSSNSWNSVCNCTAGMPPYQLSHTNITSCIPNPLQSKCKNYLDLAGSNMNAANICNISFSTPDNLDNCIFNGAFLTNVTFDLVSANPLVTISFRNANCNNVTFTLNDFNADFSNGIFQNCTFNNSNFAATNFQGAVFSNCTFNGGSNFNFSKTQFIKLNEGDRNIINNVRGFNNANPANVLINDTLCFNGAGLRWVNFINYGQSTVLNFNNASVISCDLSNLSAGAIADSTIFSGCNLSSINFNNYWSIGKAVGFQSYFDSASKLLWPLNLDSSTISYYVLGRDWSNFSFIDATLTNVPDSLSTPTDTLVAVNANFTSVNGISKNSTFLNANLSKAVFNQDTFYFAAFTHSNLQDASFQGCSLNNSSFDSANLSGVNFQYANLSNANLSGSNCVSANFGSSSMGSVTALNTVFDQSNFEQNANNAPIVQFAGAYLYGASFKYASLNYVKFSNCTITNGIFDQVNTIQMSFNNCIMPGVSFRNSTLQLVNFNSCDLSNASFNQTTISIDSTGQGSNYITCSFLGGADFSNASVSQISFFNSVVIPDTSYCCYSDQGEPYYCGLIPSTNNTYSITRVPRLQDPITCPNGEVAICNASQWKLSANWATTNCNSSGQNQVMWTPPYCGKDTSQRIFFADDSLQQCILQQMGNATSRNYVTKNEALQILVLDCSRHHITNLSGLGYFGNLQTLKISDNNISDASVLDSLPGLVELDISYNNLSSYLDLTDLDSLLRLNAGFNYLTGVGFSPDANPIKINLSNNNLYSVDMTIYNTTLQSLDLSANQLTTIGDISNSTNLTYIDVSGNLLDTIGSVSNCPNLTYIDVSNNTIDAIGNISQLSNLQFINVSCNIGFDCNSLGVPNSLSAQCGINNLPTCYPSGTSSKRKRSIRKSKL